MHPDPARRWIAGVFYAFWWGLLALAGAIGTAWALEPHRLAAAATLAVTASGVTLAGVGSAFWGLVIGLAILWLDRLLMSRKASREQAGREAS